MTRIILILSITLLVILTYGQERKQSNTDTNKSQDPSDVIMTFGPSDIDLLIDLTYSDNFRVAQRAVYRLGQLKATNAFDRLMSIFLFSGQSVSKGFYEVILASVWSLGEIGDKRAIDPLIDNYDRFTSTPYKVEVIRALGKIGKDSEKAFVFLDRVIRSTENNMIGIECARALKNIGKTEAFRTLTEILKSGKFERWVNMEIEKIISEMGGMAKESQKK
ncbi:MAG: hypothetical protein RMJ37_02615 [Spirochaetia bacterium]|nr:hypothetical protein [Spirochaetota bacterium]MCX8095944.1 hypothetical protein [Spirochaetota bacterium]MDW8112220.1 hypothetical protein [Spirochaetia bacterium]